MFRYPVDLAPDDNDTILATFPDLPGATFGENRDDALSHAVDLLESALNGFIQDRRDIPRPSPAAGRPTVAPTMLGSLKLILYLAMRARGWRKADLARALDMDPRLVDRLLDLRHRSTVTQLDGALRACGARYEVGMRPAEAA
jgi:antitoxin HicB